MPSVEETLKKGVFEFNDILVIPYNTHGIVGTLYTKKGMPAIKGLVVIHGMWGTREDLDFFDKRLADQGYYVSAINLPGHGEDLSEFNIALASEYICTAVRILRLFGIKKVGVIGHSAGAVAALFALAGYNRNIERDVYVLFGKCLESMKNMINLENKCSLSSLCSQLKSLIKITRTRDEEKLRTYIIEEVKTFRSYATQFEECFKKIKITILEALKENRFRNQRIDSLVLLGLPLSFQGSIGFPISWIKKYPEALKKLLVKINTGLQKAQLAEEVAYRYSSADRDLIKSDTVTNEHIRWLFLKIRDLNALVDYFNEIKNPRDYLHLLDVLSKKELQRYGEKEKALLKAQIANLEERKKRFGERYYENGIKEIELAIKELESSPPILSFIRRYKGDIVNTIPKLIVFGGLDQFSRPIFPWNRVRLRQFYNSFGRVYIVSYWFLDHFFSKRGIRFSVTHMLSNPKMSEDVLKFLNKTL